MDKCAETTLLPCPFCGGEAELSNVCGMYFVACRGCRANNSLKCCACTYGDKTPDEAIAAWNRRAP
jgi:hypothetical protein